LSRKAIKDETVVGVTGKLVQACGKLEPLIGKKQKLMCREAPYSLRTGGGTHPRRLKIQKKKRKSNKNEVHVSMNLLREYIDVERG